MLLKKRKTMKKEKRLPNTTNYNSKSEKTGTIRKKNLF
jgi:hypothetical protein